MTYPGGGAPGGYPGPGQQPPQGYGPPPAAGPKFTTPQLVQLGVAAVGVLAFFLSLIDGSIGIAAFLLVAALLALAPVLPGQKDTKVSLFVAALAVTGALTALFSLFNGFNSTGVILVLVLGLVQAAGAVYVMLLEGGVIKPPAPAHHVPYAPPGGYAPPSPQFGQQQQPGQAPGQQQPPPPQGQYGQPPSAQPTTFAPQQGQFGQQAPGTPPGGYPQQG
ncbi:DUF5336 domain-containing protein [Actinokineospora sp. 24-640]